MDQVWIKSRWRRRFSRRLEFKFVSLKIFVLG